MNEFVGVAFQLTAAVVLISLSAAVDASITSPHMLDGLVMDMPVRSVEHVIDRIFAVRFLEQYSVRRDSNAVNSVMAIPQT